MINAGTTLPPRPQKEIEPRARFRHVFGSILPVRRGCTTPRITARRRISGPGAWLENALALLDHETLNRAAKVALDVGETRHCEPGAIGPDPGFRVHQNPLADRLACEAHREVGVDEFP